MNKLKVFELVGRWKQRADDLMTKVREDEGIYSEKILAVWAREAMTYRECAEELAQALGWIAGEKEGKA